MYLDKELGVFYPVIPTGGNMIFISNKVYFIDLKEKKVGEGVVNGLTVSSTGYLLYVIKLANGQQITKESAFVYASRKEATEAMNKQIPISDEMNKKAKAAQNELDALREKVIGKPEFPTLKETK